MLKVSNTPNADGLWSVRDEENQRVALFYDDGLAREMVDMFNAAQQSVKPTVLESPREGIFRLEWLDADTVRLSKPQSG